MRNFLFGSKALSTDLFSKRNKFVELSIKLTEEHCGKVAALQQPKDDEGEDGRPHVEELVEFVDVTAVLGTVNMSVSQSVILTASDL